MSEVISYSHHQMQKNSEVLSWTQSKKAVNPSWRDSGDIPMGEDYFSSQQSFVKPDGSPAYHEDVCCRIHYLKPITKMNGWKTRASSWNADNL